MISRGILIAPLIHIRKGLVGGFIAFANVGNKAHHQSNLTAF